MPEMNRVKILYVVGPTRSGSTLLSRVLNEVPGVVSVGEVVSLDVALQSSRQQVGAPEGDAHSAFVPNDAAEAAARRRSALCGCMLPTHECPVWARVEASVFDDPPDYTRWSWETTRPSAGRFLLEGSRGWRDRKTGKLGEVAESVYRELVRLTDARVIVDDSKTPLYGYFLMNEPWADVIPVRLVRDPRATTASWTRPKPYPGIEGGQMPTHSSFVCSRDWLKRVMLADRLFRDSPVVRYEDFVAAPRDVTSRLLAVTGLEAPASLFDRSATMTFGTNHILSGNPDKFERGTVRIRPPSDWSATLRPRSRAIVKAATLPLLRRYGYSPWNETWRFSHLRACPKEEPTSGSLGCSGRRGNRGN